MNIVNIFSIVSIVDLQQVYVCWLIAVLELFTEFLRSESNPSAIFGKLRIPLKKVFYVQD